MTNAKRMRKLTQKQKDKIKENSEGVYNRVLLRKAHLKKLGEKREMLKIPTKPSITPLQVSTISKLCDDVGFRSRMERNSFLTLRAKREIRFLDELNRMEGSEIIKELITLREQKEEKERNWKIESSGNSVNQGKFEKDQEEN